MWEKGKRRAANPRAQSAMNLPRSQAQRRSFVPGFPPYGGVAGLAGWGGPFPAVVDPNC